MIIGKRLASRFERIGDSTHIKTLYWSITSPVRSEHDIPGIYF